MLYPKNKEKDLSSELFKNPTSEYRGTPFWAWNCELEKDELLRQIDVLKKMGMGGAHMHVRTGMATEYLSDEHMELIKTCTEKLRRENMLAYLYDEDRWPSGAAGGIVTKDPRYREKYLLFMDRSIEEEIKRLHREDMENKDELIACFDVVLDQNGCLASAKRIGENDEAEGVKWYAYMEEPDPTPWFNDQTYINTLDPAAMRRFIEVTYERYNEVVGDDFGTLIPTMFTDEPQFTHKTRLGFAGESKKVLLPWTHDIQETFKAAYGEDLVDSLPELLWELPDGKISTVRYHYHDHVAERFASAFADQCGKWCEEHGLMLTGHMMEEPSLLSQSQALGEAMRSYRSFQLPGVDMLCNQTEFTTVKQAASASHQYGRDGVLSELYGVTGWDFDFRGHKFQGDWQAALGVTTRVHHLAWVSMKGEAKHDYPATFNYQSPWWKDYGAVEDHYSRIHTALTRGKPLIKVGVIHPIESYWLHMGPEEQTAAIREQMDNNFKNLTKWLISGNIDFDFICESLLPSQCEKGGAPLRVGVMEYDTIIVPACETLRSTTLERLEAFKEAGGRLVFLGAAPKYENAVISERGKRLFDASQRTDYMKEAVLDAAAPSRMVDIRNNKGERTENLIHQLRADGDDRWLFIAHCEKPYNKDVPVEEKLKITLKGEYGVMLYDTLTGDIKPLASELVNGNTVINTVIYDLDSLLLRFTDRGSVPAAKETEPAAEAVALTVPKLVSFTLDEPNAFVLDKAEYSLDGGPLMPETEIMRVDNAVRATLGWPKNDGWVTQPWVYGKQAPDHSVYLRYTFHCDEKVKNVKLALEDARETKIVLNGKAIKSEPDGWFVDKSIETVALPTLKKGANVLELTQPFGRRINLEWCYLLGDFGVSVKGEHRSIGKKPTMLGFDDITHQGLAHYTGNITYNVEIETNGGNVELAVPHYAGAAVKVELADKKDYIIYPPYTLSLGRLPAGKHTVKLTLLGNRYNAFGALHLADAERFWLGPDMWHTKGAEWTESYRFRPLGILSAPRITETK